MDSDLEENSQSIKRIYSTHTILEEFYCPKKENPECTNQPPPFRNDLRLLLENDASEKVIRRRPRRANVSVTQLSLFPLSCVSADPQMLPSTHDSSHIVLPSPPTVPGTSAGLRDD